MAKTVPCLFLNVSFYRQFLFKITSLQTFQKCLLMLMNIFDITVHG